ncbi:hypothetical protein GCM10027570_37730 [Streptomonospora sediminis]
MDNRIEHLQATVKGTLAENAFYFDTDRGTVRVPGLFTSWAASTLIVLLAGIAGLVAALIVAFLGPGPVAAGLLAAGIAFLALFAWANRRPGWELRLIQQAVAHNRGKLPFHAIRHDHLLLERAGSGRLTLVFRGGGVDKPLAAFRAHEEAAAMRLRQQFWELISASATASGAARSPRAGTHTPLTPVQSWIMGSFAIFAEVNGQPLDRLGPESAAERAADQRSAHRVLADAWDTAGRDQLLANIDALVTAGHREDFAHSAAVAALPRTAQDTYIQLLRWADDCAANGGRIGAPPLDDALRRILFLRHGPQGDRYARLYDAYAAGTAPTGAGPDTRALAEIESFTAQLAAGRGFGQEEADRVSMLAGAPPEQVQHKHLVWDYARAMMLYRWGHLAGWLEADFCWDRMLPLAREIQRAYGSWVEMGEYYLSGRRLWAGGVPGDQDRFEEAAARLRGSPRSPWNTLAWSHPLERDW